MGNRKFGWHSGDVHANNVYCGLATLTSSAAIALDATRGDVFKLVPAHTATITPTNLKKTVGQRLTLVITTSGGSSFTLTFGTGFKSVGTLATGTDTGKVFVVEFVGDGVNFNEVARTTAM